MGTIVQRNGRHRAIVRIGGHKPRTKTFDTARQARLWINATELDLAKRRVTDPNIKIVHLIEAYEERILPLRRLAESHAKREVPSLKKLFADMTMADLTGKGLTHWVLTAKTKGGGFTKLWHIDRLRGVLKQCELHFDTEVPWDDIRRCRSQLMDAGVLHMANERDRRASTSEVERIKAKLPARSFTPMARIIDFCIASAMRIGEVTRLRWDDYDEAEGTVIVRDRKHPRKKFGNHKVVPLLGDCQRLIQEQREHRPARKMVDDVRIFPYCKLYISKRFHDAAVLAGVIDICVHDLRHEGISRLFEMGYAIEEVALVSGHEDWEMLRRYTHIQPVSLALKDRMRRAMMANTVAGILDPQAQEMTRMLGDANKIRALLR